MLNNTQTYTQSTVKNAVKHPLYGSTKMVMPMHSRNFKTVIKSFSDKAIKTQATSLKVASKYTTNILLKLPLSKKVDKQSLSLQEAFLKDILSIDSLTEKKISHEEIQACTAIANKLMSGKKASILPLLPRETPRLMQALKNGKYPWTEFTSILEENPRLKKHLLAVANSALFKMKSKAQSLEQMILPMDCDTLQKVVMTTAIQTVMTFDSYLYGKESRELSFIFAAKAATACQSLAKEGYSNELDGFLAGLTQYTGIIIVLRQLHQLKFDLNKPRSRDFIKQILALTSQLSYQVSKTWKLPDTVRIALQEQTNLSTNRRLSALGEAVYLSKCIAMTHFVDPTQYKLESFVGYDRLSLCQRANLNLKALKNIDATLAIKEE